MPLRILRIRRPSALLTAQAYESLFDRQLGATFDVRVAPLVPWMRALLGPPGTALDLVEVGRRFAAATAGHDFVCPSYEAIPLAPLLLAARNAAPRPARTRLLLIAHAAAAYATEWALLRPLLAPGDVIVTPSESAWRAVTYLCPALAPFLRVIPHPMAPLPAPARGAAARAAGGRPRRVVSLGRVHALKLVHRQIEAMAVLRARGVPLPRMDIGGPLDDGGLAGDHPYTRTLAARIRRLGLASHVRLTGAVRGDAAKGAFLGGADVVVNLSVTLEESFPKTPVEALGVGVPVLGTSWNGLRDTVGACGALLPLRPTRDGDGVDLPADAVADGLQALLEAPPPADACRARAATFAPGVVLPRYAAALEAAAAADGPGLTGLPGLPPADAPAAPDAGLLAAAVPLAGLAWGELFERYAAACDDIRRQWEEPSAPVAADRVRALIAASVAPALTRAAAGFPPAEPAARPGATRRAPAPQPADAAVEPLLRGVVGAGDALLRGGRLAAVGELLAAGAPGAAAALLDALAREGLDAPREAFWRAELAAARGDARAALELALAAWARWPAGEGDWARPRQLARLARRAGAPALALDPLGSWLTRFPDAQESGPVWLEWAVNALGGAEGGAAPVAPGRIDAALGHAHALLGDHPSLLKARRLAARQRLAALVA